MIAGRIASRLLGAPRTLPNEAGLGPALDALGGEVVRLRARDGLRLSGRWLPVASPPAPGATGTPSDAPDAEAILLLHGWSGSVAPDLVEYGPWLRSIAGVLGLDFRGHGGSDASPTTFGLREVEDVAGALAWLGERGIRRVALFGTSMGGISAIASAVVLGDGRSRQLAIADGAATLPRIVAIAADSVGPVLTEVVAARLPGPRFLRPLLAARAFGIMARRLGADPRDTEPLRIIGLLEDLPILLVHGDRDEVVSSKAAHRLVAAAGPGAESWTVRDAGHSLAHETAPAAYEARVGAFLRAAFEAGRATDDGLAILGRTAGAGDPRDPTERPEEAPSTG